MVSINNTGGVLVCDDDAAMVRIFKFVLKKAGIEPVHACTQGKDVLAIALREKPALVLLDLILPDKDGLTVLKELKSDPDTREIPVIVISAKESVQQVQAALQVGAADYVVKPFDPKELGERLRQLMDALTQAGA